MEVVVGVAIGVLGFIFLGSLVTLLLVCRHKWCRKKDLITQQLQDTSPDVNLVENMEGQTMNADVELDDVCLSTNLARVLQDEAWVSEATGFAPHCLAILKTCHSLTEKLVGLTMETSTKSKQLSAPETLADIVTVARRIGPRVDDVVRSLYPPLDPRLLEARCTALVLSVSHLVVVSKSACRLSGVGDWIDQSMADVEDHLRALRDASMDYDASVRGVAHGSDSRTCNSSVAVTTINLESSAI